MRAFTVERDARVYVYSDPISMAFGFDGLEELIRKKFKRDISKGDLFLFYNKKSHYVKALYYYEGEPCLWAKRLRRGRFETEHLGERMTLQDFEAFVNGILTLRGTKRDAGEKVVPFRKGASPEPMRATA